MKFIQSQSVHSYWVKKKRFKTFEQNTPWYKFLLPPPVSLLPLPDNSASRFSLRHDQPPSFMTWLSLIPIIKGLSYYFIFLFQTSPTSNMVIYEVGFLVLVVTIRSYHLSIWKWKIYHHLWHALWIFHHHPAPQLHRLCTTIWWWHRHPQYLTPMPFYITILWHRCLRPLFGNYFISAHYFLVPLFGPTLWQHCDYTSTV